MNLKRPANHQTDELAQRVLRDALPPNWVVNEQHRDYGKDFLVEMSDGEDLAGEFFFIQLKGTRSKRRAGRNQDISFSLKCRQAKYYVDVVKDLPVLLVVVNVNTKTARWLFVQEALDSDQVWRRQTNITLHLPVGNDLQDIEGLRRAVSHAKQWMRLRHPTSVAESIEAERQRIIQIDPRFNPEISYKNGELFYAMHATEDISLQLQSLRDHEVVSGKFMNLIDKGIPVHFEPGEIEISGSRLFEPIAAGGAIIQANTNYSCTANLTCLDNRGIPTGSTFEMTGSLAGGKKEMWFEGGFKTTPFCMRVGPFFNSPMTINLRLNFDKWEGKPLLLLPYFDALLKFFESIEESSRLTIEFSVDGNVFGSGEIEMKTLPVVGMFRRLLVVIRKAREIARQYKLNPIWSIGKCDQKSLESIEILHAVVCGAGWRQPAPNFEIKTKMDRSTCRLDLMKTGEKSRGTIQFTQEEDAIFFEEKLSLGSIARQYTSVRIDLMKPRKNRAGKKLKSESDSDGIPIRMSGDESTEMLVRLATEADVS